MAFRDGLKVVFFITWRKVLAAKMNLFLLLGFIVFLGYIWQQDSFSLSLRSFLGLFPYLFLLLSQDMLKDEIDSGALENVLFLKGSFRSYLLQKTYFLAGIALAFSFFLFMIFAGWALITKQFLAIYLLQFVAGVAAGIYYLSLSGILSFSFKGGSNVLFVILVQIFFFIGLLLSAGKKAGFIDSLDRGSFPDFSSRLKFLTLAAIFPNAVTAKRFIIYGLAIAVLSVVFLFLQRWKIKNLELEKK
jgi:hypothetical protein